MIVGAAGDAGDVDLVEVVLPGSLKEAAELQGVAAQDLGEVVGDDVDGTGGLCGIGTAIRLR